MQKSTNLIGQSLAIIILASLIQGCAAVLLGGVIVGASVIHDRRASATVVEDEKIEFVAAAKIRHDKELNQNTHVTCVSYNNTVLITGQVDSQSDQNRITELVRTVSGVSRVVNETTVATAASFGELSDDAYITSKVKLALWSLDMPGFDPTMVKVVTEQGNVYLMGLLTEQEIAEVVDKVRHVPNVKRVIKIFEPIKAESPTNSDTIK